MRHQCEHCFSNYCPLRTTLFNSYINNEPDWDGLSLWVVVVRLIIFQHFSIQHFDPRLHPFVEL